MYKHIPVFVAAWFALTALAENDLPPKAAAVVEPRNTPSVTATKTAAVGSFEALDKNGDQRISRTEAGMDKRLSDTFGIVDTDGDGYISRAEFTARPQS